MTATKDSKALMCRITEEIWNNGRVELIDELIAEDFVDHVDMPGLDGNGRARYRASIELTRAAFTDFRTVRPPNGGELRTISRSCGNSGS